MLIEHKQQKGNIMCLKSGKPKDPGTFEDWRLSQKTAGLDPVKADYDAAVKRFEDSGGSQETTTEQETEIEEAEKTEAQKLAESKSKALEAQVETLSVPLSSMIKRQNELGVNRSKGKARRSLLTSSGGGMGYYSQYNT